MFMHIKLYGLVAWWWIGARPAASHAVFTPLRRNDGKERVTLKLSHFAEFPAS